jgi:large subunit ribosomal protein L15
MKLHELKPAAGARRPRTRLGRGPGSGKGKTSGRGEKGQKSRSGYSRRPGFEGGQMPLNRRLPKRGFVNPFRKTYRTVNVERLNALEAKSVVTPETLQDAGLLKKGTDQVKVLGNGELKIALTVRAHKFTRVAEEKIVAAGGKAETIAPERPPHKGKFLKKSERSPVTVTKEETDAS